MPLSAHWRHKISHVFGGVKEGCCGGGEISIIISAPAIFCNYDPKIENKLTEMHRRQRAGDKNIQGEIDRYLFACISKNQRHLILPKNGIPHYDNLPDISAYAIGILDPTMDSQSGLQQVLLLLRQCIPLRRRTKRAQREVQWKEESHFGMQTLVRCMQGTLLGLYPNSLKVVAFGARMGIVIFLRSMLTSSFDKLHMCMQKIPYIVKLCAMEHLCNTIYDYHPGICHTLNQSGQKVEHFCSSVSTICDIFRGELNTMFCAAEKNGAGKRNSVEIILDILTQLEKIAHSYFERCTRAYRGIIIGNVQPIKNIDNAKKLLTPSATANMGYILSNIYHTCSKSVFEMVHSERIISKEFVELAWYITQIIQVRSLPQCVVKNQLLALGNRYSGDAKCIAKCRIVSICVQCAIRRRGPYGMRLRHDCRTNELLCIHCGPGTVVSIDMLGRILVVANDIIILSSCCGSLIHYSGTGYEFNTACGPQCVHSRQFHKKKDKGAQQQQKGCTTTATTTGKGSKKKSSLSLISSSSSLTSSQSVADSQNNNNNGGGGEAAKTSQANKTCVMCGQKNSHQILKLLDVPTRSIMQHALCSKHVIPHHIAKTIWDVDGIYKYFFRCSKEKEMMIINGEATTTTTGGKRGRAVGFKVKHKLFKK
jgi:hypothetical protein